ncbi:MAG: type II secretion system protein [Methylococcaceae bacterium]|jgi:general secretion pathway protein I
MRRQHGFSLLEILIAFAILGISLGILLKIFSSGSIQAAASEDYTSAVQLAEALMARTGADIPLQVSELSGLENQKYLWYLSIQPYVLASATTSAKNNHDAVPLPVQLFKVRVSIRWDEESITGAGREFELTSLKLASTQP